MEIVYIKGIDCLNTCDMSYLDKFKNYIKTLLNIITVDNWEDRLIYNLPYKKEVTIKQMESIAKKIRRRFEKEENIKVVLCKKLDNLKEFKNILQNNQIELFNGRWLFGYLAYDIVEYISKLQDKKLEEQTIGILVSNDNDVNVNTIIRLAKKVRRLTVVTNNISKFKWIESKLYDDYGIAIEVTNNKKKSLIRSSIIINLDFNEKQFNTYKLNRTSIIVNINEKIKIETKTFEGININYYKIKMEHEKLYYNKENNNCFEDNILYESLIYRKDSYENMITELRKDKVQVVSLIGNNGQINNEEFKRNVLTKI